MQQLYPLFLLLFPLAGGAQCPELIWSDEFDGDTLNLDNWSYEIGDGCTEGICGWGNNELQVYDEASTTVSDGTLKITARPDPANPGRYTSSRIISRDKQDFTYGRMEARIKVPAGAGTWPAFWMLSTDEVYGGWPQSGEIDIMEYVGRESNQVLGTIHYGQPFPNNSFTNAAIDLAEPIAEDFHEFAVEWEENEIRWFFDDVLYSTKTPADLDGQRWPFDQDFFFILNLAIGGTLGGPVASGIFPAVLEVDYVRVYGGNRPYLAGDRQVANNASGVRYTLGNVGGGQTVNWSVPEGATIVSGQGTPFLTVDWGTTGGTILATTPLACGADTLRVDVIVDPAFTRLRSLENFDEDGELTFTFATGTLTEVANPDPDTLVGASQVGQYVRAAGSQFDVLVYEVASITDADAFFAGEQRFFIDLYTDAPVGTEFLLQLESGAAAGDNYPTGRHSRYRAVTTVQNAWQRLRITPLDRPDGSVPTDAVTQLVILFDPDANTGNTYVFDNLDVYAEDTSDGTSVFFPSRADFGLTVSPNPIQGRLNLQAALEHTGPLQLDIYAATGQRLQSATFNGWPGATQQLSLDLADLAPGLYFARLRAGRQLATVRFRR